MLSVVISDTKRTLEKLKKSKLFCSERLSSSLDTEDWEEVRKSTERRANRIYVRARTTEKKKLENLKKKKVREISHHPDWVENTTNTEIPDYLERVLMLGPNFNIQSQHNVPYVKFVADVECAIKNKPEVEEIRAEVATAVSNHLNYQNQPRTKENDWIRKDVLHSRVFLKDHPEIYITKADKGNKTVIITADEYKQKMLALVSDTTTYKQIDEDPTNKILKKLNTIIECWRKEEHINESTKEKLQIFHCNPPRVYGLPKTHKHNRPLRPIVSTIGSASYRMAQYLAEILNNIVGKTDHHIKNSFEFADEISKVEVPEGCVMFSLDVTSLFTNVETANVYEHIEDKWHILRKFTSISLVSLWEALKVVLQGAFFQYENKFYSQIHGVGMGSPISPVLANICLEKIEQECIANLKKKNIHLTVYKRYVDDCLVVAKEEDVDTIFAEFNEANESLKFTIEKEHDGSIRFLDMMLQRKGNKIEKSWFPKQPDGRYLDYHSESPFTHKSNTVYALIDRALKLSDVEKRKNSIDVVKSILGKNNYPHDMVMNILQRRVHALYNTLDSAPASRSEGGRFASIPYVPYLSEKVAKILRKHKVIAAFQPCDKLKSTIFTKLKDTIPKMKQTNVVYAISCSCGKEYVGQTSQTLEKRIKQHDRSVRLKYKTTGLSQHALESNNEHAFDFESTRILERIGKPAHRLIAEKLHIKLRGNQSVNIHLDTQGISSTYNGLWKKLRENENRERQRRTKRSLDPATASSNSSSDN